MTSVARPKFALTLIASAAAYLAAIFVAPTYAQGLSPGAMGVPAQASQAAPQPGAKGFANLPPAPTLTMPPVIPGTPGVGVPAETFGQSYNSEFPLSNGQIQQLHKLLDEAKRSSAASPKSRATPETSRVPIFLTPGRAPHVLRLSSDTVSTVIFTDSTGAPWPIVAAIPGAKGILDLQRDEKKAPHIFTVAPLESYVSTNISVWLENSTVPVVLSVVGEQRYVDYMLEMAVQARGPNAKAPTVDYAISNEVIPPEQNEILNGLTPAGAVELKVVGGDAKAWSLGGRMLLRTSMLLRAPTARRVFSGADGTKVYEIPSAPVVNMASEGRTITLLISGFPAPSVLPVVAR